MALKIDHVVILVKDLATAVADYTTLGFQVVPGGEHTDGATRNALIGFYDGTYLELIAFQREAPQHRWWQHTALGSGEGLIDFALLPEDINQTVQTARQADLALEGPTEGGRLRPDGQAIQWQTALPGTTDLPFLCYDVTPRELRVPGGTALDHPNGVTGIDALSIAVTDLAVSIPRYQALLGGGPDTLPSPDPEVARTATFIVGSSRLVLTETRPDSLNTPSFEVLGQDGEGPFAISLYSQGVGAGLGRLDSQLAHGVWLELVAAPSA